MKLKGMVLSLAVITLITACTCNKNQQDGAEERVVEDVDEKTGIVTLRDYEVIDTITIKGSQYQYTYSLQHVDSMKTIINPQGLEYKESFVAVKVEKGDKVVFNKKYFKNDFKSFVPSKDLATYTMVGVSYHFGKRDDRSALYFIVTVGDPDETSDISYPLELKVNTDGSSAFNKATNLETESLNPNLNIDPSSEDGV